VRNKQGIAPWVDKIMSKKKNPTQLAEELAALTDRILDGEEVSADPELGAAVETIQRLKVAATAEPDPAFAIRLRNLAMAALPRPKESMSERLQAVISRLLSDVL